MKTKDKPAYQMPTVDWDSYLMDEQTAHMKPSRANQKVPMERKFEPGTRVERADLKSRLARSALNMN